MKNTIINTIWFILEVILIFALVQVIRYALGNWDALAIGLSLLTIALLLFFIAYYSARIKDRRNRHKSNNVITRILS